MTFAIPSLAARGPALILVGCMLVLGGALLLADLTIGTIAARRAESYDGADETYAVELHAASAEEPDPTGWSTTERGFDARLILNRIIDGFTPESPPAVLFDTLHDQMPQADPSWLTFDTSAWRTVHAASVELSYAVAAFDIDIRYGAALELAR
ncbi:MAG TPA: hypothetical protein VFB74_33925 [Kribbellaceae bacterium]|nr:hypothetical protein [Kribbellaceae bacterium]